MDGLVALLMRVRTHSERSAFCWRPRISSVKKTSEEFDAEERIFGEVCDHATVVTCMYQLNRWLTQTTRRVQDPLALGAWFGLAGGLLITVFFFWPLRCVTSLARANRHWTHFSIREQKCRSGCQGTCSACRGLFYMKQLTKNVPRWVEPAASCTLYHFPPCPSEGLVSSGVGPMVCALAFCKEGIGQESPPGNPQRVCSRNPTRGGCSSF